MSVKCVGCGAELGEHMKFCTSCGRPVEQAPAVEQVPVMASEATIIFQPPAEEPVPVAAQAPVVEQSPVTVQAPVVKQVPVTAQDPVAEKIPVAAQSPVVVQPPVAAQPPVKKKGRTVGSVLLSIPLSLLLIVFAIYSSAALSVRHIVGPESLEKILNDMEIAKLQVGFIVGGDEEKTLPEFIHDQLRKPFDSHITTRNIKKVMDEECVKTFAAELLSGYVADVFGDKGSGIVEIDRLEEFFEDNYRTINDALDYDLKYTAYEVALTYAEHVLELEERSDFSSVRAENKELLKLIATVGSYPVLFTCAGLCVLYVILLLIVNRGRAGAWVTVGICSLLTGGVHLTAVALLPNAQKMAEEAAPFGDNFYDTVFGFISNHELLVGGIFAGVFALMIVVAIIVNAAGKAAQRKAARAV